MFGRREREEEEEKKKENILPTWCIPVTRAVWKDVFEARKFHFTFEDRVKSETACQLIQFIYKDVYLSGSFSMGPHLVPRVLVLPWSGSSNTSMHESAALQTLRKKTSSDEICSR